MAGRVVGNPLKIILMFRLSLPEIVRGRDLDDNLAKPVAMLEEAQREQVAIAVKPRFKEERAASAKVRRRGQSSDCKQ
jgi:hypothetical protein